MRGLRHGKIWLVVAVILILLGCGSAGGTILAGYLSGDVAVEVLPPFQLDEPWVECLPKD